MQAASPATRFATASWVACFVAACGGGLQAQAVPSPAARGHAPDVVLEGRPTCRTCRVQVGVVQQLGSVDGPGALPSTDPSSVSEDSRGRYWLLFYGQSLPLVFGADGSFVAEVGRRGSGPGEFQHPMFATRFGRDSMVVLDQVARTATVFDADLQPARTVRLSFGTAHGLARAPWPWLLVNAAAGSGDAARWPLHLLDSRSDGRDPVRSFGREDPEPDPRRIHMHEAAAVLPTAEGTYWVVDRLHYVLSEWSRDGRLLRSIERRADWFGDGGDRRLLGTREEPPRAHIRAANLDEHGRIWVYILAPAPGWRDAWPAATGPQGRGEVSRAMLPDVDRLFRTIVEVIDPDSRRLVASAATEHRVAAALAEPRTVAAGSSRSDGTPVLTILRFGLVER